MTQNPNSNELPSASRPWGRYVDQRLAELENENALLREAVNSIRMPLDKTAPTFEDIYFQITRIYSLIGSASTPPPAPPVVAIPTYSTIEMNADWSRTWGSSSFYTGSGTHTNGSYLYQGSNPENKIGMWHFAVGSAAGKNITDVQMFLSNVDSPFQSSFTAGFGTHGNATAPSAKPGRQNGFDVGWGRGEGKWFGVPSWAWAGLSNGSIQGFTIGGIGPSNPNYAFFRGATMGSPPRLRVTYQN